MEEQIKELKKEVEALKKEIADIKANYLTVEHFRQTLGLNEEIDFTKNPYLHK